MKYLYQNDDGFTVERKLGETWYYCDILKSAIERYALSEIPDYDELDRIVRRIDKYMESSRYLGELGAPIYCTSAYASDVMLIRTTLLKINREKVSEEQIRSFYKTQIKNLDEATERYESSLWSS
ncbi:MAG: hypothetical protein ACFE96_09695 [Candidatus Hermodarchaeota archaeon]